MAELATTATSSSTLAKSGAAAMPRPAVPSLTRVTVRDGQTVAINDYVYLSTPWAPGAGEPYIIARVMEFVLASSSRKGAQALASSSGTLQVRVNPYLRQRDITHRTLHDPRLLVASMHSDVFALENIRGICSVRHRDLIGDAPAVSAWKRKDDHFYYFQLYDRYLHRTYDVIPTSRVRNAPEDVLAVLRQRYSFVVAEIGLAVDLCGPVRACAVCEAWAAGAESVRCDTCKQFFHMACLTPPLAAKPAKGYSWTCAPCSKQREQEGQSSRTGAITANDASSSLQSLNDAAVSRLPGNQGSLRAGPGTRGRGRGRGGWQGGRRAQLNSDDANASMSRETTPLPGTMSFEQRTADDAKGVRCFKCWPYRYFGEHTIARDALDPDDSIYPRAAARLGVKYQVVPPTWEEQLELGLGVHVRVAPTPPESLAASNDEPPVKVKRPPGRPPKKKKEEPPPIAVVPALQTMSLEGTNEFATAPTTAEGTPEAPVVVPESEPERGTDSSVEVLYQPSKFLNKVVDKYMAVCRQQFPQYKGHIGLLARALKILTRCNGDGIKALTEMTSSTSDDLEVSSWSSRELKALEKVVLELGAEMRALKRAVPTKKPAEIVRQFYQWKCNSLKEHFEAQRKAAAESAADEKSSQSAEKTTRAVSPSQSLWDDSEPAPATAPPNGTANTQHACKMCAATTSHVWYRGPYGWQTRRLCSSCGVYWRKYAAETPSEIVTRKREAALEDSVTAQAPPAKVTRVSRTASMKSTPGVATPPPSAAPVRRKPANPCVMCKGKEPSAMLKQCQQCSLCIHQGCYGLVNGDMRDDAWLCDACANERTLDAALVPRCVLCPKPPTLPTAPAYDVPLTPRPRKPGRPPKNPPPEVPADPVAAAAAAKYKDVVMAPLTNLHAFKPTESNNWVHLDCALYMPELVFSDPSRMRLVEGASVLPKWRYEAVCDICKMQEGACVSCAESSCKRTFHVSCASRQKRFTMGIDVTPVKGSRRDAVPVARFGKQSGHMAAVVYCDVHQDAAASRGLIAMSELDAECEPIAAASEDPTITDIYGDVHSWSLNGDDVGPDGVTPPISAAQLFAVTHKGVRNAIQGPDKIAPISSDASMHSTLRRAKRFDYVLGSALGIAPPSSHASGGRRIVSNPRTSTGNKRASSTMERDESVQVGATAKQINGHAPASQSNGTHAPAKPHCVRCSTQFSPFWWDVPANVEEDIKDASNGQSPAEDKMAVDTPRTIPAWLDAYRTSLNRYDGPPRKDALCVRCRHAVRPPIAT